MNHLQQFPDNLADIIWWGFQGVLGAAIGAMWWWVKKIDARIDKHSRQMSKLRQWKRDHVRLHHRFPIESIKKK